MTDFLFYLSICCIHKNKHSRYHAVYNVQWKHYIAISLCKIVSRNNYMFVDYFLGLVVLSALRAIPSQGQIYRKSSPVTILPTLLGIEKSQKGWKGKVKKWPYVLVCFLGGVCSAHLWAKRRPGIPGDSLLHSTGRDIKERAGLPLHCLSAQPRGFWVRTLCSGKKNPNKQHNCYLIYCKQLLVQKHFAFWAYLQKYSNWICLYRKLLRNCSWLHSQTSLLEALSEISTLTYNIKEQYVIL